MTVGHLDYTSIQIDSEGDEGCVLATGRGSDRREKSGSKQLRDCASSHQRVKGGGHNMLPRLAVGPPPPPRGLWASL